MRSDFTIFFSGHGFKSLPMNGKTFVCKMEIFVVIFIPDSSVSFVRSYHGRVGAIGNCGDGGNLAVDCTSAMIVRFQHLRVESR